MSNNLSNDMLGEIYSQESGDPFLVLLTIDHASFPSPVRLVNNQEDIVSRGNTFIAYPFNIRLPQDDGESLREIMVNLDNASIELIDEIRSVTSPMSVVIEMILASDPNTVQMDFQDLKIKALSYNATEIQAKIVMDDFLNVELTSEKYLPSNFPGLF